MFRKKFEFKMFNRLYRWILKKKTFKINDKIRTIVKDFYKNIA